MKVYVGARNGTATDVTVDGRPLNPRLDLCNHSSSGFEWGYRGSGPTQLALALLADCLGDDDEAVSEHYDFRNAVVAGLPYKRWRLTEEEIRATLATFQNE